MLWQLLQVDEHPDRQVEFGKFVSQQNHQQLQYEDEDRQERIYSWMEQSNGATQQAKDPNVDRAFVHWYLRRKYPRKKRIVLPMHHSISKANTGSLLQPPKLLHHGKMTPNSKTKGKATKRRPKQATVSLTSFLDKVPLTCSPCCVQIEIPSMQTSWYVIRITQ